MDEGVTYRVQDFVEVDEADGHGDGLQQDGSQNDEPQTLERKGYGHDVTEREIKGKKTKNKITNKSWRERKRGETAASSRQDKSDQALLHFRESGSEGERVSGKWSNS